MGRCEALRCIKLSYSSVLCVISMQANIQADPQLLDVSASRFRVRMWVEAAVSPT